MRFITVLRHPMPDEYADSDDDDGGSDWYVYRRVPVGSQDDFEAELKKLRKEFCGYNYQVRE